MGCESWGGLCLVALFSIIGYKIRGMVLELAWRGWM